MNSSSFDRILRQVIIVPVVAVLLGAAALGWQMNQAFRTVSRIGAANQTITETEALNTLVVDQETGLRGFQTTGDSRFLEPYDRASEQIPAVLDQLRRSSANPRFLAQISGLQDGHQNWQSDFAAPMIAAVRAGDKTSDVDLNLQGKRQMDNLRAEIDRALRTAGEERDSYLSQWRHQVRIMLLALIVIGGLIGLIIGLYTRRQIQDVSNAYRQSHNILRIRAEQTFRSEQKLRTTLESIGDGVITCDAEGRIETMNERAGQLTGWTFAEAHKLPLERVFTIIDQTTREPIESPVAKVQRTNRIVNFAEHTILLRKDGTELFIDDSGSPIRDKYGKLIGVVLVFRDITMAIKSQEALLANEKLAVAGRLAATIAHEIHNPLDSVSNLLFLMDGESTPEESAKFLELAKLEIARVTQISRAMLSLYRESQTPIPIDIKEMLESILLLMERRFAALGVTAKAEIPPGLVVRGFPAELRQVFTNLLTNAAEATAARYPDAAPADTSTSGLIRYNPHSIVRVSANACPAGPDSNGLHREAGVMVTIQDRGKGIPQDVLAHLFKPFFTTKGERGTGLGLWVSRGIMTKHGGSIDLTSTTEEANHGTTVKVFMAYEPVISVASDEPYVAREQEDRLA